MPRRPSHNEDACRRFMTCVANGINWSSTIEGDTFWRNVYRQVESIVNGQTIIPLNIPPQMRPSDNSNVVSSLSSLQEAISLLNAAFTWSENPCGESFWMYINERIGSMIDRARQLERPSNIPMPSPPVSIDGRMYFSNEAVAPIENIWRNEYTPIQMTHFGASPASSVRLRPINESNAQYPALSDRDKKRGIKPSWYVK